MPLLLREADGGVTFPVRVTPRASRDEIKGEKAGALAVRLKAPPVEGAANEALARFLGKALGIAPSSVAIVRGGTKRTKLVRVSGVTAEAVSKLVAGDAGC